MFNNTEYLFFLTAEQTKQVEQKLDAELATYEKQLGIKYTDQKIRWDFWNAMLYAQTLCTTIGYGHLYTTTAAGRVFTMIYAIFGIPLVLSILDDLGKLLTRILKTPWWLIKCGCRRMFRYCTKQTLEEIRRLDEEDKRDLEIFDLPIPIAIFVVVAWIFICSATFCLWEHDWDYFIAFYFFFISLSTIGLGDITPTQPKYLLMLFIYIIIGLSLVSMCINLIQSKLERTYEAGRHRFENITIIGGSLEPVRPVYRRGSSLGVFKTGSSYSLNREVVQANLANKLKYNKSSQTLLSFPSPSRNSMVFRTINNTRMKFLPRTLSIDDVMKLVDTEEGDILLLTELTREESGISETSTDLSDSSQIVISKSFDGNFNTHNLKQNSLNFPLKFSAALAAPGAGIKLLSPTTLNELEEIEELEDRIILGQPSIDSLVHFRSRLSLIPEQHSVIDEECEESTDESQPLDSISSKNQSNRSTTPSKIVHQTRSESTQTKTSGGLAHIIGNLLGKKKIAHEIS
uniref:Potassium channel domain-containing protein n=1 Tax=Acrobeloides nanus TaxID=290746 RepID=A0A914DYZ8_9BILA